MISFLILAFLLLQLSPAIEFYKKQTEIKVLSEKIKRYFFNTTIPAEYMIVSNVPEITYYLLSVMCEH